MSNLYNQRLAQLKKELSTEIKKRKKNKKKFTDNQQIMINFINAVTNNAIFNINGTKIILRKGTSSGGFIHILEKHFCKNCPGEITLDDIINIDLIIQRGLKLNNIGVSNPNNIVLNYKRGNKEHNLILKEEKDNELVISFYSVD